jgi:hypothetical protein
MSRFILSSLFLFASAIFAFFFEGGTLTDLVLPSPIILVACIAGFAVLAVWSIKDWGRAWKDAFLKDGTSSSTPTSIALWAFYEKACYSAGVVGLLLGVNIIFANMSESSEILRSIGIVQTTPILAVLFGLVARILRARVENARE